MQFAKNVIHKFTFTLPFTKTRLELIENEIFVFIWKSGLRLIPFKLQLPPKSTKEYRKRKLIWFDNCDHKNMGK